MRRIAKSYLKLHHSTISNSFSDTELKTAVSEMKDVVLSVLLPDSVRDSLNRSYTVTKILQCLRLSEYSVKFIP